MTDRVPADQIEGLVGAKRHPSYHYGRAVSETGTFYILHSQDCLHNFPDLRECPFSKALDRGLPRIWRGSQDRAIGLLIQDGHLLPDVW